MKPTAGARILIVEDERLVALELEKQLQRLGFEICDRAHSVSSALEAVERHRPDLVLMDISLSDGGDGIEAADHIRRAYDIPVVYLTAYSDPQTLDRARITEPFGYILKPYDARSLQVVLETSLYRHRMERALRQAKARLEERVEERTAQLELARDEAQAASRMKTEFLANMSHEIRTPMNGLQGMLELLAQTELSPEQRDYLHTIRECSNGLLTLLDDVLEIADLEAGGLRLQLSAFEPRRLVSSLIGIFRPAADQRRLQLEHVVDEEVPARVRGDRQRLRQILVNLVGNAIKYTREGRVAVAVRCLGQELDRHRLRFEVKDTGIGIEEEDQGQIYSPFFQVDGSMRREHGGTGLGLFLVKRLAEAMGGEVGCSSVPGQGSTFWIELMLQEETAASDIPRTKRLRLRQRCPQLLVVEDNAINGRVLLLQLHKMGCSADLARDGVEALEALEKESYALIFMDCQMPRMDGYEATRKIRELHGRSQVIVALTAHAFPGEREKCMAAGMDDYLAKPVSASELEDVIARWLPPESVADAEGA